MPRKTFKKYVPKRGAKMRGKKKQIKSKAKSDSNMVIISPPNKEIAPKIAYVKFNSELDFFITANITTGVLVSVFGNNLNKPWASTFAIGSVANTTITTGSGATASALPSGFSQWIGSSPTTGIYTSYLVYATKMEVEVYPQALGDSVAVGLAAFNNAKTSDVPATLADFNGKPFSKQEVMGSSKGKSKITLFVKWHQFWGLTRQNYAEAGLVMNAASELQSPFGGSYNSAPVINSQIALIIQALDNANIATACTCKVKMTYYTKMYNPRRQTMAVV